MVARYGDFVLYRPRVTSQTALLWGAPIGPVCTGADRGHHPGTRPRAGSEGRAGAVLSAEEQAQLARLTQFDLTKADKPTQSNHQHHIKGKSMTMAVFAGLVLLAFGFIFWPLLRRSSWQARLQADTEQDATQAVLYQEHLADLEKSLAIGEINQEQFEQLKLSCSAP